MFQVYECSSAECATLSFTAEELPWEAELIEPKSGTIREKIGVKLLKANCAGTPVTFKGTLEPKVVNGTEKTKPTVAEFDSESGKLTSISPEGLTATVSGTIRIVGFEAQELITAENL